MCGFLSSYPIPHIPYPFRANYEGERGEKGKGNADEKVTRGWGWSTSGMD